MFDNEKQIYENLAIEHMDNLYDKAIRTVGSSQVEEDLVLQTYASLYSFFEQFDKDSDFKKWRNEILMLIYTSTRHYLQEFTNDRQS